MRKVHYTLVTVTKKIVWTEQKMVTMATSLEKTAEEAVDKLNSIRRVAAAMRPLVTISTVAIC